MAAARGLWARLQRLGTDSSVAAWEVGAQTVLARVIPGQERTNWKKLLSNETVTQNKSENRGYPMKEKGLEQQEK